MKLQTIKKFFDSLPTLDTVIAKRAVSTGSMVPGDIYIFSYDNFKPGSWVSDYRIVLLVSCRRGPGYFRSSRGNLLVSAYEIDLLGDSFEVLVNNLYKKRVIADYYKITRALDRFLGESKYKTFDLSRMRDLYEVDFI